MIKIATRGSALALAQTRAIAATLERAGERVEILIRKTTGDMIVDRPFTSIPGRGFFTKELEEALFHNEADLAVHSLKDLPVDLPGGLALAATPDREDPADILIIRREVVDRRFPLPVAPGATIGTSSTRRRAQWAARRPDTRIEELRGNITTRVDKLHSGLYDAILLARAGISRLNLDLSEFVVIRLDPCIFVPAPGQGALGLESRADDNATRRALAFLNNAEVRAAVDTERSVLNALGGGCSEPVGVYARRHSRCAVVTAAVGPSTPGEAPMRRAHAVGHSYEAAAERVVEMLKHDNSIIPWSLRGRTIVITQQRGRGELLARELEERGARVWMAPLIETVACADDTALSAIANAQEFHYILFTSRTAAEHFINIAGAGLVRQLRSGTVIFGAVGRGTAEPLEATGIPVALVSKGDGAAALAELVVAHASTRGGGRLRALFPCAVEPRAELIQILESAGIDVTRAPIYQTTGASAESLKAMHGIHADFTIFFSPSGVRTFKSVRPFGSSIAVAIGPTTLAAIRASGLGKSRLARSPEPQAVLEVLG